MRKITKEEFIQRASIIHCLLLELKYNYTNKDFNNLCNQIDDRTGLISKCEKGGKL